MDSFSKAQPQKPQKAASSEENLWALLAHLSIFILAIIGPLIIMIVKKDESPFIERHAKEALNFQIAVLLAQLITLVTCIGPLIVAVAALVYAILATLEANKGNDYSYPYTIRFVK